MPINFHISFSFWFGRLRCVRTALRSKSSALFTVRHTRLSDILMGIYAAHYRALCEHVNTYTHEQKQSAQFVVRNQWNDINQATTPEFSAHNIDLFGELCECEYMRNDWLLLFAVFVGFVCESQRFAISLECWLIYRLVPANVLSVYELHVD